MADAPRRPPPARAAADAQRLPAALGHLGGARRLQGGAPACDRHARRAGRVRCRGAAGGVRDGIKLRSRARPRRSQPGAGAPRVAAGAALLVAAGAGLWPASPLRAAGGVDGVHAIHAQRVQRLVRSQGCAARGAATARRRPAAARLLRAPAVLLQQGGCQGARRAGGAAGVDDGVGGAPRAARRARRRRHLRRPQHRRARPRLVRAGAPAHRRGRFRRRDGRPARGRRGRRRWWRRR
mmetsp:Transcript_19289/g.68154  ORF Transcript_19289/g.68154 Transcript_19289/m.68154 type:complete len:238 (-) Transcript_19289:650-1363(-)